MSKFITRQHAIDLLYAQNSDNLVTGNFIMDEFGNYIFPTDVIISKPNSVCGSAEGCEHILVIEDPNKAE